MAKLLFLDIETLPDLWLAHDPPGFEDRLTAAVPKRMSKAETIAKWKSENRDEVLAKGSLDRFRGLTHVIGWATSDDPVGSVRIQTMQYEAQWLNDEGGEAAYREAEHDFLDGFQASLPDDAIYHDVVTWGGNHFDLPWLALRALRYGLPGLGRFIPMDKWGKRSIDLSERFKFTDYRGTGPSATKAGEFVLGTSAVMDEGSTGADVFPDWKAGESEKTVQHCINDVNRLRAMYARVHEFGGRW